jgi:antitoxin (DNA-binding transcriptional repressor) of toxin-antitoxin stability system
MCSMERIGIRELRQQTSAILRRVAAGETFEVADRGRPVATLSKWTPTGLDRLVREGLIRPGEGDLLDVEPLALVPDSRPPSEHVSEGRDDRASSP